MVNHKISLCIGFLYYYYLKTYATRCARREAAALIKDNVYAADYPTTNKVLSWIKPVKNMRNKMSSDEMSQMTNNPTVGPIQTSDITED